MIGDLIGFEWRYHSRQISFLAACLLFFLFGFVLTSTGFGAPNININSPYNIMQSVGLLSLMSVFVLAVFNASAILRDREYRMEEIVFSTVVEKHQFLFARFAGSFLAAVTAFSASAAGMAAATLLPSHDPARLGAMQPGHYLWALAVMAAPNLLFAAAMLFAIAVVTRSLLASSVGAVLIYVLYFAASAWSNSPLMAASVPGAKESVAYASLLDPFGLSAFFEQTRYWTPAERNTQLTRMSGVFLANRLLWMGAALAIAGAVYRLFSFRLLNESKTRAPEVEPSATPAATYAPVPPAESRMVSYLSATAIELRGYLRTLPFLALTLLWAALAASEIASTIGSGEYGSKLYPTSGLMLAAIQRPLHLIALVVIIYYSAEIVWRERTVRIDGILNATPTPSAVFVLAKWTALATLTAVVVAVGSLVAVLLAMSRGYGEIDPGVIGAWAWFGGAPLILFATAAVLVQTVSPHKYVGMLIVVFMAMMMEAGPLTRLQHHLWHFGSAPGVSYSAMNGFGPFIAPFNWYMLHWSLIGSLFLVLSVAFWRRAGSALRPKRVRAVIGALFLAILVSGAHILYNTTVLNAFTTANGQQKWKADYEKKYIGLASLPQPRIARIDSSIDLYPAQHRYRVHGHYLLRNETSRPVQKVLVSVRRDAREAKVSMGGARLLERDERFGMHVFELERPLAPGGTTRVGFDVTFANRGFRDDGPDTVIVDNGSFALGSRYLPAIGYRRSYELTNPNDRRKQGLQVRLQEVSDEPDADQWVEFDMTVSTPADQIAVTSGKLEREWFEGGRRFRRYHSEGPVANVFALSAASYEVARTSHGDVKVEIYHDASHRYNVERMLRAARDSLRHFEESFGPYPHGQLKIVEVAPDGFSGLARPDTIFLGEARAFLIDAQGAELDLVSRRTAHEVAHQWWGLHLVPANVPGATVLTESLTKYAELLLLNRMYGRDAVRRSLTYELDLYLSGRTGDSEPELPLARAGNQPYLYYRKGAIVMSALADLLGEKAFQRALRTFMSEHGGPGHRPTTKHLIGYLNAVATADQQELIDQWMNRIILYDLKLDSATARNIGGGRFEVALRITATKLDGSKLLPMNEDLEIGISGKESVLYLARHRLHDGANEITVLVHGQPESAGIDPNVLRIDLNRVDNRKDIQTP